MKETGKLLPFYSLIDFKLVIRSLFSLIMCCAVLRVLILQLTTVSLTARKRVRLQKVSYIIVQLAVREACEKQNKEATNYYECNKQIEKNNVNKSFVTCKPSVITRNRQIVTTPPGTERDRKR